MKLQERGKKVEMVVAVEVTSNADEIFTFTSDYVKVTNALNIPSPLICSVLVGCDVI